MRSHSYAFILSTALIFSAPAQAKRGPGDSGGGDEVGLEFVAAFESSLDIMRVSGRKEFNEVLRLDWRKIQERVKVLAVDRKLYVMVNGVKQESVAINTPAKQQIEVNRARWKALANHRKEEGIALHEMLSLQQMEKTGFYPFSGLYLSIMGLNPDPVFGGEPERAVPLPSLISKIYPYNCRRRFVEGEEVSGSQVTCVPNQHLGFISAEYTFYLYANPEKNNFYQKFHESFFPSDICGIQNVSKITCDQISEPAFGLSATAEGAFVVGIQLTAAPAGDNTQGIYGYAALLDANGRCPTNLVEARPYVAAPQSMIEPLPSSFLNVNGALNNTVFTTKDRTPAPFQVWRYPNSEPCDIYGKCSWPQGGSFLAQSVSYLAFTPRVCVIPKSSL